MTGDDSEWESTPRPIRVKSEPGSRRSSKSERRSSKSERRSSKSERPVPSSRDIIAQQDAEYEISQAEDIANAIRRGVQGKLEQAENQEEMELRWALQESLRVQDLAQPEVTACGGQKK